MKRIKAIFCILFRHSNILEGCFGYMHCGRCGALLGDTLAGAYKNKDAVVIGHNCDTCRANYKKMGFIDKFLTTKPFKEK